MRVVLQRVRSAKVWVEGAVVGSVDGGMLILVGMAQGDALCDVENMATKVANLRIFSDTDGKMNLALSDIGGGCLVVSQFTLLADCSKGRRPHFGQALEPGRAKELCEAFAQALRQAGVGRVETGIFGANMQVELCNDGPVTLVLDSSDLRTSRAKPV